QHHPTRYVGEKLRLPSTMYLSWCVLPAANGRAAPGVSLRRLADVARPAGCRWEQGGTASCHNIDAENGHRSGLSQAQHIEIGAGPQDLSVSAAWAHNRSSKPGVVDR